MVSKAAKSEAYRVGRFSVVGVINTLIDLAILNVLNLAFHVPLIAANTVSTTIAMIFSFIANRSWVFKSRQGNIYLQIFLFFALTAFGLYGLQNGVLYLLTHIWLAPGHFFLSVSHFLHVNKFLSDKFVLLNGAKACAIAVSLVWNYVMYRKVVFRS